MADRAPSSPRAILARVVLVVLAAVWVVQVIAQAAGLIPLLEVTLVLLMPLLILATGLRRSCIDRSLVLVIAALVLSWGGDASGTSGVHDLLRGVGADWADTVAHEWFLAKLGLFLLAHLCYIAALAPAWRRSVWARRRGWLVVYGVGAAAILALLLPYATGMAAAVICYGVILTVMAISATGRGALATLGGVAFMVSDTLVAAQQFIPAAAGPTMGVAIMITYVGAQILLAHAASQPVDQRP